MGIKFTVDSEIETSEEKGLNAKFKIIGIHCGSPVFKVGEIVDVTDGIYGKHGCVIHKTKSSVEDRIAPYYDMEWLDDRCTHNDEFKVGDVVRIRSWDDMEKQFGLNGTSIDCRYSFTEKMKDLCGMPFIISYIDKSDVEFEGNIEDNYSFSRDMIEYIKEKEDKKEIDKKEIEGGDMNPRGKEYYQSKAIFLEGLNKEKIFQSLINLGFELNKDSKKLELSNVISTYDDGRFSLFAVKDKAQFNLVFIGDYKKELTKDEINQLIKDNFKPTTTADDVVTKKSIEGDKKMESKKEVLITGAGNAINEILKGILISDNSLKFSMKGIAVQSAERYNVYERSTGNIVSLDPSMIEDKIDMFLKLPTTKDSLQIGDLMLQDEKYFFIRNMDASGILAIDISSGDIKTLIPKVDLFGNSMYTKIYSAVQILGGYDLLAKTDTALLTVISTLFKNKDNLNEYIKDNYASLAIPFLANKASIEKYPLVKKYKSQIMMGCAAFGIVATNFDLTELKSKKVSKSQIAIAISLIGLGIAAYVGRKKRLDERFKSYIISKNIKGKVTEFFSKIKSKFTK